MQMIDIMEYVGLAGKLLDEHGFLFIKYLDKEILEEIACHKNNIK